MANAFRVGVVGLLAKEIRLVELVLRHANLNQLRFKVCKAQEDLKKVRIVIGRPSVPGTRLLLAGVLSETQYIEIVDAPAQAKSDLFVVAASLITGLMPVLKRAIARLLRMKHNPDTMYVAPGVGITAPTEHPGQVNEDQDRRPNLPRAPVPATGPVVAPTPQFNLPLAAVVSKAVNEAPLPVATVKILVVDDSPTVRQQLVSGLANMGMHADSCAHATSALEQLKQDSYDLIIADVVMPDVDGYEFTRKVRKAHPSIPVVILTSKSSPFDKARGALAGCATFLSKPVSRNALESTLLKLLNSRVAPLAA